MRVIATAVGFYGKLRQPGEHFDVGDGESGSWFEPVEKPAATKPVKPAAAKPAESGKE